MPIRTDPQTELALGPSADIDHADSKDAVDAIPDWDAHIAGYKLSVVRRAMPLLAVVTCTAYVAYTLAPHTVEMFGTRGLVWSAPFVAMGIARFVSLWHPKPEPPTEAMLRDPIILGNLVIATAIVLHAIYG